MNGNLHHLLPSRMVERAWHVIVVGAGGTGSAVLPSLARLHHAMLELGHASGIECTVFDDDRVSPTNVGRQGFYPNDVGEYKASLIVNRLNMLMGTNWRAETKRFTKSVACHKVDLVIGCVDTRAARRAIVDATKNCDVYYLDCGNDTDRGQVVIGQAEPAGYQKVKRANPERLPHVGQLFPELIDASLDAKDDTPSCSMAEALRKQSLVINQAIAVQAFNLLWTMFRTGAIPFSGVFVNLKTGRTNPIPLDPVAWARFGYAVPTPPAKKASKSRKAKIAA
ncbi:MULTISPECIES: PRTRC system ThiF family protein [unclassified Caballeronia]|uniref:PRTRC system ThiF family protein n=1 Tax=unclassified Caballeronia TaxID=2646786 RepID=UPI00285F35CF|nr:MULTISPECIES: PRTRC system ThiF family protein [unclassified Caballeronia]MDR5776916.1 PRTRC system ThiF family protein [Caballeronia sp. LZ002]MDR5798777.1 PRTRC system ThiF family protein [Caballeronia sp. LZ001]MDR5852299.1 PRTRC system ThiF family protein [Caballeronia sp. LZ003]